MRYYLTSSLYTGVVDILENAMSGYDPDFYREEIQKYGLHDIAVDEWNITWAVNTTDVFDSEEAAMRAAEGRQKVVPFTFQEVQRAVGRLFDVHL